MDLKKTNYHTHTMRCNHAFDTDEEMVLAAREGGFSELGFSDHSCWNYSSRFRSSIRMELQEFDGYYESVQQLKEKYQNQIKIYVGLECEYFPMYMEWLEKFIKEKKLDYIILGNHFDTTDEYGRYYGIACEDDRMLHKYVDDCIAGLESGLYTYLAHPDLFMRGRRNFDAFARKESERLCLWCKEHRIPLEYNLEGIRMGKRRNIEMYPYAEFWKLAAEIGNDAIIGVDAHEAESLRETEAYQYAVSRLAELGMNRIIELPIKK